MITQFWILLLVYLLPFNDALSFKALVLRSPKGGGGGGGGHGGGGGGGHPSTGGGHPSTGGGHPSTGGGHPSTGGSDTSHGNTDSGSSDGSHGNTNSGGSGGGGGGGNGSGNTNSGNTNSGSRGNTGAGTGKGGSGDTGHPSIQVPSNSGSRNSNYFSGGGGKRFTLGSGNVFAGRQMGGGTREQVLGTQRFGSGYPYYVNNPQTRGVHGNPFPFGFWPIYWPGHGYSEEYGDNRTVAAERPGGNLSMVNIAPLYEDSWSTTIVNGINETYWMVGDQQTVATMLDLLVVNPDVNNFTQYQCTVKNTTIQSFNSSDPNLPFHFSNVIQWYRSSSFALAYVGYNNSYAFAPLNETTALGESTPLPTEQLSSTFLHCINSTLLASIAILDGGPKGLDAGQIAGIVIGSVAGAILVGVGIWFAVRKWQQNKSGRWYSSLPLVNLPLSKYRPLVTPKEDL